MSGFGAGCRFLADFDHRVTEKRHKIILILVSANGALVQRVAALEAGRLYDGHNIVVRQKLVVSGLGFLSAAYCAFVYIVAMLCAGRLYRFCKLIIVRKEFFIVILLFYIAAPAALIFIIADIFAGGGNGFYKYIIVILR